MPLKIEDGTGRGNSAKVNANNQLETKANNFHLAATNAVEDGSTFIASSGTLSLPTDPVEVWHVINEGETNYSILHIEISWNGGDSNYNRPCEFYLHLDPDSEVTDNYEDGQVANTNLQLAEGFGLTSKVWDETGTGLELDAPLGDRFHPTIIGQGSTQINLLGTIVMPPGTSIIMGAEAEEAGKASINIMGTEANGKT